MRDAIAVKTVSSTDRRLAGPRVPVFGFRFRWLVAGVLVLFALLVAIDWVADLLWFDSLGYASVFWRLRLLKLAILVSTFVLVFVFLYGNAWVIATCIGWSGHLLVSALGLWMPTGAGGLGAPPAPTRWLPLSVVAVLALLALVFAVVLEVNWDTQLRFSWATNYGLDDPVFGLDVGFYLFTLPYLELIQNTLVTVSAIVVAALSWIYVATKALYIGTGLSLNGNAVARRHLAANLAIFLSLLAFGYYLDRFGLLQSETGAVYGAGYTAAHFERWGLGVVAAATLALAVLLPVSLHDGRRSLLAIAGYGLIWLGAIGIGPSVVQGFVVEPNELALETPFLGHNIRFTREAYGLGGVEERSHAGASSLDLVALANNRETVDNIRLWDWRPLSQTFRQLQRIRTYYDFGDVDVDRYRIGDEYRQVMLAARELAEDTEGRAETWVNERLQFTHGYGLAMSLTAEKSQTGSPTLIVRDLPPRTAPGLELVQPAVYYGEQTSDYRLVNTRVKEFDYPHGDENVYTHYQGSGGVRLDAFWKRLLFAWDQSDVNLLITQYATENSRLQLRRAIDERIGTLAPFLRLDADPYPVASGGRIYWIQDAYTLASTFPYAEPVRADVNYIRNSVKAVVDAYDGSVDFYVVDPKDPVLRVYRDAFPALFRPLEQMPEALRAHLRYPVDLFHVQVKMYSTYHMTVPQVFYNAEDLWEVPREKYGGEVIRMAPYYVLMRLPGEARLEFLLMTPLTPRNRDNMIAWFAARCDLPGYGQLVAYKLSKEQLFLGPMQVEAIIDQDTLISQQLSLWDQRGSRVIRGNLLVIPIADSFLYVEPVYLIAEDSDIPQLKRVIVSDGERIAMAPTLEVALAAVFGGEPQSTVPAGAEPARRGELEAARQALEEAEAALRGADWRAFGAAMERLRGVLGDEVSKR